jgi:putative integration host factor subunit alpha
MDNNDVIAARRRALQEALHNGDTVMVSPTGEVQLPSESSDPTQPGISVPQGKLA